MLSNTLQVISLLGFSVLISTPAAFAQDLSDLPPCATKCLATALASSGNGCSPTDFACFCKNPDFISATATCYVSSCPPGDLVTAQKAGVATCGAAGVQLPASGAPAASNGVANTANGAANGTSGAGSAGSPANGAASAANGAGNATNGAADPYSGGANVSNGPATAANAAASAPNIANSSPSNNNSTGAAGSPTPTNQDSAAAALPVGVIEARRTIAWPL
ncbi:hypothetical protein VP01_4945g2 [Puccinia sorghi]|uniref:CFEM domain-containing protein n=1 Tax=Puccinia sorghi TaxID=27349 RepID=A0A0L6ULY1_9BASI|nr:hypothetical protein VP01_4945g2 [Puccinia sorghi]